MFKKTPKLFDLAAGGDAGGAGGGAPAAATPAPAGDAPAGGSVMSRGASAAEPAAWAAPDKYHVKTEAGETDWQATARKIDEGRSHLEKRMGSGDVPPADVAGYKLAVPEAHAEALKGWDMAADQELQGFVTEAHKLGFTQKQLDHVLGAYAGMAAKAQGAQLSPEQQAAKAEEDAAKALGEVWKEPGEFDKKVGEAYRVGQKLAAKLGVDFDEFNAALGNSAMALRVFAALAPEMQEDTPQGTQQNPGDALDWEAKRAELVSQRDALPASDPRRAVLVKQISEHYSKRYKG